MRLALAVAVGWLAICHIAGCTLSPSKLGELPDASGAGGGGGAGGAGGAGGGGAGGAGGTGGVAGGGGMVPDGVVCGTTRCAPGSEVCCTSALNTADKTCAASCPTQSYARRCDGPEDCGGAPCCCGAVSNDIPWIASCGAGTTCAPIQHCHTAADCPAARPHCCPSATVDIPSCSATVDAGCT